MFFLKIIKAIFVKQKEEAIEKKYYRENLVEPDFIDYDGMGNQGRFPSNNKK